MQKEDIQTSNPVLGFAFAILGSIIWCIVFYFIWKPLVIPALIWLAWYIAPHLRKNLSYSHSYFRPIMTGLIWGIALGTSLYFLNDFFYSPRWWAVATCFLGFLMAGYVSYGHALGIEALEEGAKLKTYHLVSLSVSIIVYIASLLLLRFVFKA